MNYGYIRVSSDKQTVENQRFEIKNFCRKNGMIINHWFEETRVFNNKYIFIIFAKNKLCKI